MASTSRKRARGVSHLHGTGGTASVPANEVLPFTFGGELPAIDAGCRLDLWTCLAVDAGKATATGTNIHGHIDAALVAGAASAAQSTAAVTPQPRDGVSRVAVTPLTSPTGSHVSASGATPVATRRRRTLRCPRLPVHVALTQSLPTGEPCVVTCSPAGTLVWLFPASGSGWECAAHVIHSGTGGHHIPSAGVSSAPEVDLVRVYAAPGHGGRAGSALVRFAALARVRGSQHHVALLCTVPDSPRGSGRVSRRRTRRGTVAASQESASDVASDASGRMLGAEHLAQLALPPPFAGATCMALLPGLGDSGPCVVVAVALPAPAVLVIHLDDAWIGVTHVSRLQVPPGATTACARACVTNSARLMCCPCPEIVVWADCAYGRPSSDLRVRVSVCRTVRRRHRVATSPHAVTQDAQPALRGRVLQLCAHATVTRRRAHCHHGVCRVGRDC